MFKLSLRDNPLVVRFVQGMPSQHQTNLISSSDSAHFLFIFIFLELAMTPTTLKEISARVVKTCAMPFGPEDLPRSVIDYLSSANCCVNPECKGKNESFSAGFIRDLRGKVLS